MAFSIQTNINSLIAQENLRVNSDFQSRTIQRLTSGFRINQSGDDAAGLAIANKFRSDVAELTQGVRNANDGISTLQIVDGGMNNIGKMLDRLKTLATQSASDTFTGDRTVLNNEFQTLLNEIDRQAQAVGLDQGGAYAKSLSVFIGGGRENNGIGTTSNGSVSIDLSNSTVDATALGLKGVQAVGVSGTDIGSGSTTSVANILANALNSTAEANTTVFVLRGPGFADASGVEISVNTSGVGSTSELVERINSAIDSAESVGTESASALKAANIKASIVTTDGASQLAFTSSVAAFQVEAGDRMANALMGNFERNASMTGTNTDAYVDTSVNRRLTLAIDGGDAFNVDVTQGANTSKGQIVADLNADATFSAAATAYLDGDKIVIRSKGNSATSEIEITTTALGTALGLSGTASAEDASTGAAVSTRVAAAGATPNVASMVGTAMGSTTDITTGSNDTLDITVGATNDSITLTQGTDLTKEQLVSDINTQIAGSNLNGKLTASLVGDRLVLTAVTPGESVTVNTVANDAYTELGLTADATSSDNVFAASDTIKLRFDGGGLAAPVDITLDATTAGTTTVAQVLTDLSEKITASADLAAAGISLTTSSAGNNITFTSSSGEKFNVTVTGDTTNKLGFGSFLAGSSNAVDYSSITAGTAYSTGIASGTGNAVLEISLNGGASSTNALTVALDAGDATAATMTGTQALDGTLDLSGAGAAGQLVIRFDASTTYNVDLGNTNAEALDAVLDAINTAIAASGTATLDEDRHLVIQSNTVGAGGSVEILAATDDGYATAFGLTEGSAGLERGTNASLDDVVRRLNAAISSDSQLVSAGLVASNSGGKLKLESGNGTYFRVDARGTGDLGFGKAGTSFAGNSVSAAPATSAAFHSQGADMSSVMAYSGVLYGNDDQVITLTALDAAGTKHSLGITLQNDGTARSARTVDEAVNKINTALQASADTTLKQIVAVKVNDAGVEKIRFLSTLKSFDVSMSNTAGGTGITPVSGNVDTSEKVGSGANASIDSQSGASDALTALGTAITTLGSAQAAVGKAQNQLSYALALAQSQISNYSAAESRIRDADIASEAANLTKAQVLQQASLAAMAQANSAPQAVLALLRG